MRGERCTGAAGGLRTRTSKHFFLSSFFFLFVFCFLPFLSPKYIILELIVFFIHSCKTPTVITDATGSRTTLRACCLRVHTSTTPGPTYIQYFLPSASLCVSFRHRNRNLPFIRSAALPRVCPLYPRDVRLHHRHHHHHVPHPRFRCLRVSLFTVA